MLKWFARSASPGLLLGLSCDNALVGWRSTNWIPFFFLSKSQAHAPQLHFYENKNLSKNEQGNKECALIIRAARGAERGKAALKGSAFRSSSLLWISNCKTSDSWGVAAAWVLAGLQRSSLLQNIKKKVCAYSDPFGSEYVAVIRNYCLLIDIKGLLTW